jgi:hypothetical protein
MLELVLATLATLAAVGLAGLGCWQLVTGAQAAGIVYVFTAVLVVIAWYPGAPLVHP